MKNNKRIAALTIGQSPRTDLTPEIRGYLGNEIEILEAGALDGYNYQEIFERFSPKGEDDILVTRLRDGSEVIIGEKYISDLLNKRIKELEKENLELILLLCTGKFADLQSTSILLKPQKILYSLILKLELKNFAVIIPNEMQKRQIKRSWNNLNMDPIIKSASPYKENNDLISAAEEIKNHDIDLIYLDCMGYSKDMKNVVAKISNKKVILPREMISLIIKGFF